ncbi:peroxisomal membrane protein PEX16-like isoform X2 [Ptychodera flava]|uniref:peroxisomal membrane protein PEX16-like isoform X2 n=1 Tax=Ptychodera flava TaxID=63121 RepID=UPI003969ED59
MAELSGRARVKALFSKISSKYHGYCTSYKEWVAKNPEVASQVEQTFRIMSYFVAGRFEQSQELAELVYAASNLMVYVNDAILRKATKLKLKLPPPSQYRLMSWLTIIEYIEVFVEIAAKRLWGEAGRWVVIVIIQVLKATLRAVLLICHKVGLQSMPPLFPLNRQRDVKVSDDFSATTESGVDAQNFSEFEEVYRQCEEGGMQEAAAPKRTTFRGKRTGRVVRTLDAAPPLNLRTWKLPTEDVIKEEPRCKYLPPTQLTRQRVIAESLHIARPLVHLASMFKFGQQSWKPWLLSCGLDVSSILMMGNTKDLNVNEEAEMKRRTVYLLYYLLRSPFYDRYSKIIFLLSAMANKIPGVGLIARPLMEYLPYWQQVYFYNWGY